MALGRHKGRQSELLVTWAEMPRSPGHAFYDRLQAELLSAGFDGFVEASACPTTRWPCPGLTDTPDRLNGLRGVDGGEQQTAPVLPGRVQARGGGCDPQRPLSFGSGG